VVAVADAAATTGVFPAGIALFSGRSGGSLLFVSLSRCGVWLYVTYELEQ